VQELKERQSQGERNLMILGDKIVERRMHYDNGIVHITPPLTILSAAATPMTVGTAEIGRVNTRQQYSNIDTDSITCFYTNADSLLNKRSELLMHVHNIQPRIIAITEVQPKNTSTAVLESEFHIENYQCYLSASGGRGVLLYIHNTLESMEVVIGCGTYVDAVWCTVTMNGTDKLLVGCVYRSPNISASDEEQLNDMMTQACCFKVSHKLIMGDFNHPDIDWSTGTCCRGPGHSAVAFIDIVNDAFLFQHCLEPTHSRPGQVSNTLDLVFTDEEEMIGDLDYITPL